MSPVLSLEERAAALTPAQVRRPNVNVGAACSIVLGNLSRVKEHLPDILEVIPGFDTDLVHGLRALASFTLSAYGAPLGQGVADKRGAEYRAALALREKLTRSAEALSLLGLAKPPNIAEIRAIPRSYPQLPLALLALQTFFLTHREALEGRLDLPWSEIVALDTLATRLSLEGSKRFIREKPPSSSDQTLRAYTLMANAYDEVRAALAYVRRHHHDADRIAPPFANRRGSVAVPARKDPPAETP
ncbi:MAG: hypothetical protein Q8Q09_02100 [Deltaproteobacteria bacterium]|nr:hypothetical protein [Deltaproteobacteria bacterium]